MDTPEQRTPPESNTPEEPPFVAGLPDAPLERPSDFPDYDGPLVCPFYGPDHPARSDEESKEAFNEDVARVAFSENTVGHVDLVHRISRAAFRGDKWLYLTLKYVCEHAERNDPGGKGSHRFKDWDSFRNRVVIGGVRIHLEAASLSGCDLRNIDLSYAQMSDSSLNGTRLNDANLNEVVLDRSTLRFARLNGASLEFASLRMTDCRVADLRHCTAGGADFDRARLYCAKFDNAVVRYVHGILWNDSAVKRLDIQGNAPDPWSTLRRTYTGPMFFVHLLLLVAFLLPYAAKVLTLTTTARGYDALRASLDAGEGAPPGAEAVRAWLDHFDASHTDTHAWWVLLGGTHAWWWALVPTALAILGYNVLRGHLTLTIGVLRDQADRVERTPTLAEYYGHCHPLAGEDAGVRRIPAVWWRRFNEWRTGEHRWQKKSVLNPLPIIGPWHLHQLARVLFWISIASVALHAGSWLWTTTVPVPK